MERIKKLQDTLLRVTTDAGLEDFFQYDFASYLNTKVCAALSFSRKRGKWRLQKILGAPERENRTLIEKYAQSLMRKPFRIKKYDFFSHGEIYGMFLYKNE